MKKRLKGFTLIELLVVIAIIALLLSILLPSLGKAKKIAKGMLCSTRIRQLSMGTLLYAQDYEGRLFPVFDEKFEYWYYKIAPYLSDGEFSNRSNVNAGSSSGAMEVLLCPVTKNPGPRTGSLSPGSKLVSWKFLDTEGSFGMNLWLVPNCKWSKPPHIPPGDQKNFFARISDSGSGVPLFADSMWVGSYPYSASLAPTALELETGEIPLSSNPDDFMKRFCIDRHGMAINVGFVDGSMEKVKLEELWTLRWSKNFGSRVVEMP
jgi:prepilin-type N-terminal cleavage/methylation domain-containing protein